MKHVSTWQEIRGEFREISQSYPGLSAQWLEMDRTWILRPDLLRVASGDFIAASRKFEAAAAAALTRLKKKSQFREPWQLWLDLLRDYLESSGLGERQSVPGVRSYAGEPGRYTDWGGPIYVSRRELNLMQESGESLRAVRNSIGYTMDDEFKSVEAEGMHLRHPDGRLALDGVIACVPDASANFCEFRESKQASSPASKRQNFMRPHIFPTPRKPTLSAVAFKSGVPQSSLSRWYRGENMLSSGSIDSLAKYLKVDPKSIPN